jgi:hypothetical protein
MYNGKVIPAAQSADTMTHPNYRSKGLFGQLSKLTFELCRELGIRLIFGFPNQNFYKAAVNTGWKEIGALDCFVIPLKTVALESIAGRLAILKPAFQSYARHILGKYRLPDPGLPNSLFDEGFGGVLRDDRYLRYKTYSRTSVIEIGRARIWFKIRNGFIIGDLMGLDPNNFPAVMGLIQKIAKRSGVKELQFHASRGTRVHALFAAAYPARPSFPVIFQDFGSGIPLEKIKFTFADIDIF